MEINESEIDKKIRIVLGLIFLMLGTFIFTGTLQIVALILGAVGIFTGLSGFCLLYKVLGIKTNK